MNLHARALNPTPAVAMPGTVVLGCLALAARPISYRALVPTIMVGALGFLVRESPERSRGRRLGAVALGSGAFLAARALESPYGVRFTVLGVVSISVAAVAEELFFRRFVYGWLIQRGPLLAVVVSSALFAIVHLPTYGTGAMPIDLTAGLVLGWQRWSTGTWTAPAVTHVFANLLQMG